MGTVPYVHATTRAQFSLERPLNAFYEAVAPREEHKPELSLVMRVCAAGTGEPLTDERSIKAEAKRGVVMVTMTDSKYSQILWIRRANLVSGEIVYEGLFRGPFLELPAQLENRYPETINEAFHLAMAGVDGLLAAEDLN